MDLELGGDGSDSDASDRGVSFAAATVAGHEGSADGSETRRKGLGARRRRYLEVRRRWLVTDSINKGEVDLGV